MKRQRTETILGKRKYDTFVSGYPTRDDIMEERYYPYLYF
jgi:hypothetical protein